MGHSLPQGKKEEKLGGLGSGLPGRWTTGQTPPLSFCDILFVLIDECIHFLNGQYDPKLVIPSSKHQT